MKFVLEAMQIIKLRNLEGSVTVTTAQLKKLFCLNKSFSIAAVSMYCKLQRFMRNKIVLFLLLSPRDDDDVK